MGSNKMSGRCGLVPTEICQTHFYSQFTSDQNAMTS